MSQNEQNRTPVNIEDEMKRSYLDYAMSVIIGRALPDVRDGLKPAHRRVLYAMSQMGLASNRAYRKCAKVIGEVIGNYHPQMFFNQVQRIPFEDHGPPLLLELIHFCREATKWLRRDPANIMAVHCKGGKGRTGIMIAVTLLSNTNRWIYSVLLLFISYVFIFLFVVFCFVSHDREAEGSI